MNFEPAKTQQYQGESVQLRHWMQADFLLWALFGNAKDGVVGDANWNPERVDTWKVRVLWWLRNPMHNLTWHVLGVAHEDTVRYDERRDDGPGMNRAYSVVPKYGMQLPYWRYIGDGWEGYFGWRARGNFGLKLVGKKPWALIACVLGAFAALAVREWGLW